MMAPLLIIAGVDSSGGAGLLRDLAAARDMHVETRVAVTAVTAQDDRRLAKLHPVPPEVVAAQIRTAGDVAAIKIGVLGTAPIVAAVAEALPRSVPVVLDPVMQTSPGDALLDQGGIDALIHVMLPRVGLLTPNLPELEALGTRLGARIADERAIVSSLQRAGAHDVLVKGGHAPNPDASEDRLYLRDGTMTRFPGPRFRLSLRGTGCQLATGIAAGLARGLSLPHAIATARQLVEERFRNASTSN